MRFSCLRHKFPRLMLFIGVSPKVIREAVGHILVAFTLDNYSHIINGIQEKAMLLLNEVIPEGVLNQINTKLTQKVNEGFLNNQF